MWQHLSVANTALNYLPTYLEINGADELARPPMSPHALFVTTLHPPPPSERTTIAALQEWQGTSLQGVPAARGAGAVNHTRALKPTMALGGFCCVAMPHGD